MNEYHKIQTVFKRGPNHEIIFGEVSEPVFGYLYDNPWVWTEKIDGTNIRVMWDKGEVKFGGKTNNASIPAPLVNRLRELFEAKKFSEKFGVSLNGEASVCLYGEGCGAKIQKGGGNYKADGQDFVLFDVKIGHWWLERDNVDKKSAPIVLVGSITKALLKTQQGFNSAWGNFIAEGLVGRPLIELKQRNGERVITKIKHKDFMQGSGTVPRLAHNQKIVGSTPTPAPIL